MKYYQIESKIAIKYPMLFRHLAIWALLIDFFLVVPIYFTIRSLFLVLNKELETEIFKWKSHFAEQILFAFAIWHTDRGIIVHNPNWKYYLKVMGVWVVVAFVIFFLYGLFSE